MGFHLYFYLILVDYLILYGVEIVSELILLLQLQMVLEVYCEEVLKQLNNAPFLP